MKLVLLVSVRSACLVRVAFRAFRLLWCVWLASFEWPFALFGGVGSDLACLVGVAFRVYPVMGLYCCQCLNIDPVRSGLPRSSGLWRFLLSLPRLWKKLSRTGSGVTRLSSLLPVDISARLFAAYYLLHFAAISFCRYL